MTTDKLGTLTALTLLAILTSFIAIFIAFFEGPQVGHYINSCSLLLTISLASSLLTFLIKDGSKIIKAKCMLLTVLIFGLLAHLFIAVTFINIRYGYSNWEYKNILTMEFPESEGRTN